MRAFRSVAVLSLSAAAASGWAQWRWLDQYLFDRIQITGSRTLGFHRHTVEGDREAFDSLTYYGQGGKTFTDTGSLSISGKRVFGALDFDLTFSDNRFNDPDAQRLLLTLNRGPVSLQAGDIQGSLLNTNAYASLGRAMKGAQVSYAAGPLAVKALYTETKGSPRTISLQGANTSGPYFLQSSRLIPDSEQVEVDGRTMALGTDYVVDYESGALTFLGRVIPPTSTIVVTYETYGYNTTPGTLMGAGATLDLGSVGRLGVTGMEQKSRSGGTLSSRVERFQGFGAPSTPYFLEFEPLLSRPITVRVDGLLQTPDIDYYFDTANPAMFFFRRFVPESSTVEVAYTPKPIGTADGDRRVIGFDYRLPLGKHGYVQYDHAIGELRSDATPLRGTARGLRAGYTLGDWQLRGGWRDIPDTFVGIESRGFARNEKAVDFGATYERAGRRFELTHKTGSVGVRTFDADGNLGFRTVDTSQTKANAQTTLSGATLSADYTRTRFDSDTQSGSLDALTVGASRTWGRLDLRVGADAQTGEVNAFQDGTWVNAPLSLLGARLDATYRAAPGWTWTGRAALNSLRVGDSTGAGRDWSLSTAYRPTERFGLDLSYTDSGSGALTTLAGFTSAYGWGYGGNGFTSGASNLNLSGTSASRLAQAKLTYRFGPTAGVSARAVRTYNSGAFSANTETTGFGLAFDWAPDRETSVALSLDQTTTRFMDSPLRSSALSLAGDVSGRLGTRWDYRVGMAYLLNGGTSAYRQNSLSVDGSLSYRLSPRQNLSVRFQQGLTSGYLAQSDFFAGLFYEHQLFRNVSLIGSYKVRRLGSLDDVQALGAYRSQGFDLELSFNFGS